MGRGVPNTCGSCAEPCVLNPAKGAVWLLLFTPHTSWDQSGTGQNPSWAWGWDIPLVTPLNLSEGTGLDTSLPRQSRAGAWGLPGGTESTLLPPCPLPTFHSVPSVNYKYISHGGRSSDKPCGSRCSRALLPVCWPWHFSHSLCTKSQSSTQRLQVLRAAAIPMATTEQHVDNHHQVIKHCKETQSIPSSHSLS